MTSSHGDDAPKERLWSSEGKLARRLRQFSSHDLPQYHGVKSRDWARDRILRDDVVAGRVSVSHEVRGAGRLCVAPEGESNQEILGIAVREARQVMSG